MNVTYLNARTKFELITKEMLLFRTMLLSRLDFLSRKNANETCFNGIRFL